jgi:mono/diheme cytochrome c family protein
MTWLAVVLAFVILGLGVVMLAFGAGRSRRPRGRESQTTRRVVSTGIALVCLGTGLAIPALIIALSSGGDTADAKGVELTASETRGRELFVRNCSNCHTLSAANAVGRTGPNLDTLRPPAALVRDAIVKGRARGLGQMPAGLLTGEDVDDVSAFVAKTAGR